MESQTLMQGRGRPSKYKEEYPDDLLRYFGEYLRNPSERQVIEEHKKFYPTGKVKETFVKYKTVSKNVPTLFNFALKNGVSYRTMCRWAEERVGNKPAEGESDTRPYRYEEFRHAYKLASEFQKEFLVNAGMTGAAPPAFVIFTMKNMVGWRDAMEQRLVDKDGKDRPAPGYILLPPRKSEEEAAADFVPEAPVDPIKD